MEGDTEDEEERGAEAQQQLLLYPLGKLHRGGRGGSVSPRRGKWVKKDATRRGACSGCSSAVSALLSAP